MNISCFGDSHAVYLGPARPLSALLPQLAGCKVQTSAIQGSTITGFGKRESTLNTGAAIAQALAGQPPDFLVLCFGQVDVELGYPYRRYVAHRNVGFEAFVDDSVQTYVRFIAGLGFDARRIVVKGINVPVLCYDRFKALHYTSRIITENLADPAAGQQVLETMKADFPDDHQRTAMHLHFNAVLKRAVTAAGCGYFDINDDLVCRDTGLADIRFIPAKNDHHLVDSVHTRLLHFSALLRTLGAIKMRDGFPPRAA